MLNNRADRDREKYEPPVLKKLDSLKAVTYECPSWQCSVVVPPSNTTA